MAEKKNRKRFGMDVEVVEEEKLSSRVTRIRHQGKALKDMEEVQDKAEEIQQTVRYLEDELKTVEVDEAREAVVLRSEEPTTTDDGVEYYEVEVSKKGHTDIQRKHYKRKETELEDADFVVSERQLERLGRDLERISKQN